MRVVIVGADGRMGRTLLDTIDQLPDIELAGAIVQKGSTLVGQSISKISSHSNSDIVFSDDPLKAFSAAEAVIDFTVPIASIEYAAYAAQMRIVHVIGTTGFNKDELEKISAAARHARIVKSGNMSLGVNLLAALVKKAAQALDKNDFDIEIAEMHHKHKVDAPSGTALLLGQAAAEGREIDLDAMSVRSRDGHTGARQTGTIGFATLRGGSVVGDHSVIFAGEGERLVLEHFAQDRSIFARGAFKAALWAQTQKPGLYSMADVLGMNDE